MSERMELLKELIAEADVEAAKGWGYGYRWSETAAWLRVVLNREQLRETSPASSFAAVLSVRGERAHTVEFEADSMKALKGKIYSWTFEDVEGENAEGLRQWLADNDIRRK